MLSRWLGSPSLLVVACGMANPRSASNAWSSIKKKLFANVPTADAKHGKASKTPKAPGSARKRKAEVVDDATAADAAAEIADDNDDGNDEATPTPVKKPDRAKIQGQVLASSPSPTRMRGCKRDQTGQAIAMDLMSEERVRFRSRCWFHPHRPVLEPMKPFCPLVVSSALEATRQRVLLTG